MKKQVGKTSRRVAKLVSLTVFCAATRGADAFSADAPTNLVARVKERAQQIPERNPMADNEAISPISGVRYSQVLNGLDRLYPPTQLEARNAQSRKDGYWPFINQGKDPPECFTYGEFDFYLFAELLDKAHGHWREGQDKAVAQQSTSSMDKSDWTDKVFVDIGSGAGRLVVAAAALHPTWKVCRGIELLPSMHESAQEIIQQNCLVKQTVVESNVDNEMYNDQPIAESVETPSESVGDIFSDDMTKDISNEADDDEGEKGIDDNVSPVSYRLPVADDDLLPMSPVELRCGSFSDPYTYFGDADVIFMFSSALNQELLSELSCAIGRQCRPGTIIITTDYRLDLTGTIEAVPNDSRLPVGTFRFDLVEQVDGWCWCTGGQTTAYFHRVVESVGMPKALERPIPTLEDICYDVAIRREKGELTDSDRFLLGVANTIRFQGLPEAFVPRRYR